MKTVLDQLTGKLIQYDQFCTIKDIFGVKVLCPAKMYQGHGIRYLHPSRMSKQDQDRITEEYRQSLRDSGQQKSFL